MIYFVLLYITFVMIPVLPGGGNIHVLQDVDTLVEMVPHPEVINSETLANENCKKMNNKQCNKSHE